MRSLRTPGPRTLNNGLLLHWGSWPGVFWTCGAGWMAHWFYDRYLYTGDREFLARRTVPLLKECANSTKISCLPTSRLCAARARMGDAAYKCIEDLATRRMIFPSMIDSHNADHGILCVDGNGCTPEIINNMLIFAQPGLLDLLPAWRIVPRKQSFSRIPSG